MTMHKAQHYDQVYFDEMKEYASRNEHVKPLAQIILSYKPKTVLDVGCGHGYLVNRLILNKVKATGIDFSPFAGSEIPGHFYRCDAKWIPLTPHSFDVVFSSDLLEHFEESELEEVISEMKRMVKPGGVILAYVCYKKENRKTGIDTHKTVKSEAWWKKFLSEHGVTLIERFK